MFYELRAVIRILMMEGNSLMMKWLEDCVLVWRWKVTTGTGDWIAWRYGVMLVWRLNVKGFAYCDLDYVMKMEEWFREKLYSEKMGDEES